MTRQRHSEADVAAAMMEHLAKEGWDCYPEVELPGGRADIVAVRPLAFSAGNLVHIVETKASWSMALLEQAISRTDLAHYVSIAAPLLKRTRFESERAPRLVDRICRNYGLGVFGLSGADFSVNEDRGVLRPRLQRGLRGAKKIGYGPWRTLASLHEDQKRFTPGTTSAAGYSTDFSRTMDRVADYVREHPGATVKEIIARVDSHYQSDSGYRSGVLRFLESRFDDIEARHEGRCFRFYPVGAPSIEPDISEGK